MFVVGVGDDVNLVEVNGIASTPSGDHVVMMRSRSDSAAAAFILLNQLCR